MAAQLNTMLREAVEHVGPLPHAAEVVSAARRRVKAVLADWNVSCEIVEDCLLVVSELLTNAIVHALPPAELRLSWVRAEGLSTLRVEVTDAGSALPAGQSPPESIRTSTAGARRSSTRWRLGTAYVSTPAGSLGGPISSLPESAPLVGGNACLAPCETSSAGQPCRRRSWKKSSMT